MVNVHCSYHKNLTVYFSRVFSGAYNKLPGRGYKHFNSHMDNFSNDYDELSVASVNNHYVDAKDFIGIDRISRFVRDPRDLIVSGYYYHKRGAEEWTKVPSPTTDDWKVVNGNVPEGIGGKSYYEYLNSVDEVTGMLAELSFRKHHLESMLAWPESSQILVQRYEDILGNEEYAFDRIAEHFRVGWPRRLAIRALARHYRAGRRSNDPHIRSVVSKQWVEKMPEQVHHEFLNSYSDILDRYQYTD